MTISNEFIKNVIINGINNNELEVIYEENGVNIVRSFMNTIFAVRENGECAPDTGCFDDMYQEYTYIFEFKDGLQVKTVIHNKVDN